MKKIILNLLLLLVIVSIIGCSKADRQDKVQAPPPAKYEMVEAIFQPMPGETGPVHTGQFVEKTCDAIEIGAALEKAGVPREKYVPLSNIYGILDSKWFLGEFTDSYQSHLKDVGIRYTDNLFICGQYSTVACSFAVESAARYSPDASHPALGWIILNMGTKTESMWHAINVFYDGNRVIFYEPQTVAGFAFREVKLTKEQLSSVRLCVF
jgi:hypothetical protein